jgi:hypothetical protein
VTRAIVVTGCDVTHHPLAAELLASLRAACGRSVTIGFVRVGDDPLPEAISGAVDQVAHVPDADFHREQRQGFRLAYLGVKPRLPELFPGYDVYVWMDGDTWIQNAAGLSQILHAANLADIAMHPELDPNYYAARYPHDYMREVYTRIYGEDEARRCVDRPMLNSGVFAARAASPVWPLWREALGDMRERAKSRADVWFSDQIPLHRLIVSGQVSVSPLRAVNNWLVGLCAPAVNLERKRLLAPTPPFEEINILHLIGRSKVMRFQLGAGGREITFRYPDIKALFAG